MRITHSKVSAVPDGPDAAQVRPSDWNEDHVLVDIASQADLDAVETSVSAAEDDIDTLQSELAAVDGRVTEAEADIATLSARKGHTFLHYGGAQLTAGNTNRYANPVGHSVSPLGTNGYYYISPVAGNIVRVHYRVGVAHTTNTVEVRARVTGAEHDLDFEVAAGETAKSLTLATPVPVLAGDSVACRMDHNGATSITFVAVVFEIEYDP